ncbi:adenine nucleotide alpha hydrolases [Treponema sp. R8-4-B8]
MEEASLIFQKHEKLKQYLRELESVAIAFSSGVDSTFLLKTAHDVLGDKVIAVTARSCSFPERELKEAVSFCESENIRHIICDSEELNIEGFAQNPANRCYLCKNELFTKIWAVAREHGIENVAEGSNLDDNGDYRPGLTAVTEQGVKSPLRYARLTKEEIRFLSKNMGLPTWDKQSFACLSSRFPYGESITPEKLGMIDKAEQLLLDMGLRQVRVRHHGNLARIETDEDGFLILTDRKNRENIYTQLKQYGFTYIAVDLLGYRTGSMNETLALNKTFEYI